MTERVWSNRLAKFANRDCFIGQDYQCSYADLLKLCENDRRKLLEVLPPGSVVGFRSDFSPASAAALIALHELKSIVIPTATKAPYPSSILPLVDAEIFVSQQSPLQIEIYARKKSDPILSKLTNAGLVLFTSGTTGEPKGVVHDWDRLLSRLLLRSDRQGKRIIALSPLHRIAGVVQLFGALARGDCLIPAQSLDPESVATLIEKEDAQILPASPSFLAMFRRLECWKTHNLRSLEKIFYGSEPMPTCLLKDLSEALPWVQFHQVYGSTELGILRTRSESSSSLWIKAEEAELKFENGRTKIRSAGSMLGYIGDPAESGPRENSWFDTKDFGEAQNGWFRILGRDDGCVKIAGEIVSLAEVEDAIRSLRDVDNVFLWTEPSEVLGHMLCARIFLRRPEETAHFRQRIWDELGLKLGKHKIPQRIELSSTIPLGDDLKASR